VDNLWGWPADGKRRYRWDMDNPLRRLKNSPTVIFNPMHADLAGALRSLNQSWRTFEHRGTRMTRTQVKAVLEYGLKKGYTSTAQLTDDKVDAVLAAQRGERGDTARSGVTPKTAQPIPLIFTPFCMQYFASFAEMAAAAQAQFPRNLNDSVLLFAQMKMREWQLTKDSPDLPLLAEKIAARQKAMEDSLPNAPEILKPFIGPWAAWEVMVIHDFLLDALVKKAHAV
jgi:hypothetical protein